MYQEALKQYKAPKEESAAEEEQGVLVNKFLVGCDPEFVVLNKNGDFVTYGGTVGEIGSDHGGSVVELRPKPAKGAYTIVHALQRLIKDARLAKMRESGKWRAGASVKLANERRPAVTLGGHIHLDINPYTIGKVKIPRWRDTGGYQMEEIEQKVPSPAFEQQVKALDHLTRRLEALDILPQRECESRRNQIGGYGRFGDTRFNDEDPNHPRYEYRTMASWLYDPKVAFICLTAAKLAAVDPKYAIEAMTRYHDYAPFKKWIESFASKDTNAKRASERLLGTTVKSLQVDPDTDFKERWEKVGF